MPKTEMSKTKTKTKIEDDRTSLKGTLASVFLLGLFLIVTWLGVYFLFMDRL
ncbi:cytochrome c oxidase subunit 2A [Fredinandcohnia humi]